jgi:hypothetical protein
VITPWTATALSTVDVFSARIAGATLDDTAWNDTPGLYWSMKYPLMSMIRCVPDTPATTVTPPFVPAGTITALAIV